jgi:cytochrome c
MLLLGALAACDRDGVRPPAVAGGSAELGKNLVTQYQCGSCHRIPGVPAAIGSTGPSLETFGQHSYIAGHIPNYPDALARWIVNPPAMKPGTLMPSMGVSEADARHMAAYLYTLR